MGEGILTLMDRQERTEAKAGSGRPFPRLEGVLHCGELSLQQLAEQSGTPLFVYDGKRITDRFTRVREAFAPRVPLIAYSAKANPNLGVLALLARHGSGADIVSGGELYRAMAAGVSPSRILFAGVGKTREEMRAGIAAGILAFNVESPQELTVLADVASESGKPAPFGVRVNLDIDSPTLHEYTRTGHATSKFGVPASQVEALFRQGLDDPRLVPVGLDVHIGSQITAIEPFLQALDGVLALVDKIQAMGCQLSYIDLGGGFGVAYSDSSEIALEELGARITERLASYPNLQLVLEPGRFIVGDAGVLLTEVLYIKESGGKTFVVTDAGMTELIRPSHYGGVHPIEAVVEREGASTKTVDVVGPICETGDFLARDREMPVPEVGQILAVQIAGAYGFTMASNYNSRRRPAEILVLDGKAHVVRERESYDDLIRGEVIPPELLPPSST